MGGFPVCFSYQSAWARLAPFQYNTVLQSRQKRSSRVKIFETGEKEKKHSLGSLSKKNKQKAERKWEAVDSMLHSVQVNKQYLQVIHSSEPREDVGPWVKLQQSLSPQPLLFCLQMPSNNSDKNSLQNLDKNLDFPKSCQALFQVQSALAVTPQLSSDLPAAPSIPALMEG